MTARPATSAFVRGRNPMVSTGSPRGLTVSITTSQSPLSFDSGSVNVIGSAPTSPG